MGKNTLKLDTKGFKEYGKKLDELGADLKPIFNDVLEQIGETIGEDTHDAVSDEYLPAAGKYRRNPSKTDSAIIDSPKVEWSGNIGSIGVGFDYNKPGAGGFLITGTPRMKPDKELNKMYKGKRYMKGLMDDVNDSLQTEIDRIMGG